MKMRKKIFKVMILLLVAIVITMANSYVFAEDEDPINNPDYYDPSGSDETASTTVANKAKVIVNVIQVIGIIVAVVSLMIIGIKYMVGSLEERADYKKTMLPWILGCIMVVSVTSVPKLIISFSGIFDTTETVTNWAEENGKIKLILHANGDGATFSNGDTIKYVQVTANIKTSLKSEWEPTWEGHTFLGWAKTSTATSPSWYSNDGYNTSFSYNNTNLYAVWSTN